MSQFNYGGRVDVLPTPIICEEEPLLGLNGGNFEGGHCNSDRIAHTHPDSRYDVVNGVRIPRGGGYYASIDGSVRLFAEGNGDVQWWSIRGPKGTMARMDDVCANGWGNLDLR